MENTKKYSFLRWLISFSRVRTAFDCVWDGMRNGHYDGTILFWANYAEADFPLSFFSTGALNA